MMELGDSLLSGASGLAKPLARVWVEGLGLQFGSLPTQQII